MYVALSWQFFTYFRWRSIRRWYRGWGTIFHTGSDHRL